MGNKRSAARRSVIKDEKVSIIYELCISWFQQKYDIANNWKVFGFWFGARRTASRLIIIGLFKPEPRQGEPYQIMFNCLEGFIMHYKLSSVFTVK